MEQHVVLRVVPLAEDILLHHRAALPQPLDVLRGGVLRRHAGHPRFCLTANFRQIQSKLKLIRIVGEAQRIRNLPGIWRDIGTLAPSDFQHIPRHQQLDALPDGPAAYMEQLRKLKFAGQLVLAGQVLLHNQLGNLFRCPFRQGGFFCFDRFKHRFFHSGPPASTGFNRIIASFL